MFAALNDYALAKAMANLPLTGHMQPSTLMSRMLGLLPDGHAPCFFLLFPSLSVWLLMFKLTWSMTVSPILSP